MLTILTGETGSGKTTRLRALYASLPPGTADGFASERVYAEGRLKGYDLVRLTDGARARLCVERSFYDGGIDRPLTYRRFVFDPAGFRLGEAILRSALADPKVRHLLIDEIGPVELQGRGFAVPFRQVLREVRHARKDVEVYVCVRSGILEEVRQAFAIVEAVHFA